MLTALKIPCSRLGSSCYLVLSIFPPSSSWVSGIRWSWMKLFPFPRHKSSCSWYISIKMLPRALIDWGSPLFFTLILISGKQNGRLLHMWGYAFFRDWQYSASLLSDKSPVEAVWWMFWHFERTSLCCEFLFKFLFNSDCNSFDLNLKESLEIGKWW